jgi:26S proteasome non-ATPase regulatory subunit 10
MDSFFIIFSKTNDQTPLYFAIENGHNDIAIFLINKGADVDIIISDKTSSYSIKNRTLVHFAAKHDDIDLFRILLSKGLDVNKADEYGITPLLISAEKNNFEMCKFLVENGAEINVKGTSALSPLHFAAQNGNFELVKFLVEHGADVRMPGSKGFPFKVAKDKEIRQYLADKMKAKQ